MEHRCANAIAVLSTSAKLTSSAGAVLLVVSTRPDQPCRLTGSLGQGWRESLAMDHRIIGRGEWPGLSDGQLHQSRWRIRTKRERLVAVREIKSLRRQEIRDDKKSPRDISDCLFI